MESELGSALWRQYDTAIQMLADAVDACPDELWTRRLWPQPPPSHFPAHFAEFWHVTYHALVWLDLYLAGIPEEEFAPPPQFAQGELDSPGAQPAQPYTKQELRGYLQSTRRKCRDKLTALTDEEAWRPVEYPWSEGRRVSYLELQLYNMRHVQEHAAQLSLFIGQQARDQPFS